MFNPQMTSSQMELLPLVCLCLLSWSGTTSADQPETVVVAEGGDAILNCYINANMETGAFEWTKGQKEVFMYVAGNHHNNGRTGQDEQFKGRVSHFEDELKHGNASIKITNASMADSGDYTCEFPNNQPSPTFNVKLVVGAAPKPSVTILHETENSALLQCEAHGVPDLEVHWQDSDGNILPAEESQVTERGGLLYITVNKTVNKRGHFYCVATQKNISHTISAEIFVRLPVIVEEGSDVILPCSIGINIENENLEWKKNGRTVLEYEAGIHKKLPDDRFSHFKDELKHGNASILIRNTKVADSGDYTCDIPHNPSHEIVHIKLVVGGELKDRTGENIPGAAPKPSVTTVNESKYWSLLKCEAHGVPDLVVQWKDSDGNILAEDRKVSGRDRVYITLLHNVTQTGIFHCVATQKNISHRISEETSVYIDDFTGWIVAGVFVFLFVVAVGVQLYKCYTKLKHKRELQEQNRIIEEANEKIRHIIEELQEQNRIIEEANEKTKKMDEELQEQNRIIEEANKKIKKITEELQEQNRIIEEANEKIRHIIEELQKQNRIIEEANEKIKKINEGSSDRPAESVPLNPVNSPA